MKFSLPELGLSCEKMNSCPIHKKTSLISCNYCSEDMLYNSRVDENEKSVLVIDEEKFAKTLGGILNAPLEVKKDIAKYLSQNAKSFMRIVKDE